MSLALELLLDKVTNPSLTEPNWVEINNFIKEVKSEGDSGAAGVVQVILDKMRSKNIATACNAITVMESVVKSCGYQIHAIIGKFRFLNELIKMVSPKYCADTPQPVKRRIYGMFIQWNFSLVDQGKVREAYQMLIKQGVVFPDNIERSDLQCPCGEGYLDVNANSMTKRDSPLEENKKQADRLAKLLKSKDPNDLIAANRLIKKMADQDARKNDQMAAIYKDLEIVKTNIRLLTEMLQHYSPQNDGPLEKSEIIKDLYQSCEDQRTKMFSMARDVESKEEILGEILKINDELTRVMDLYKSVKAQQDGAAAPIDDRMSSAPPPNTFNADFNANPTTTTTTTTNPMDDLLGDLAEPPKPQPVSNGLDDLLGLDLMGSSTTTTNTAPTQPSNGLSNDLLGLSMGPPQSTQPVNNSNGGLGDLASLYGAPQPNMMQQQQQQQHQQQHQQQQQQQQPLGLDIFGGMGMGMPQQQQQQQQPVAVAPPPSLDQVNVQLSQVQQGTFPAVTAYEKNNLRVVLNFAKNPPHPTIAVVVVSVMNFGPAPVQGVQFQAAVPKTLQVKLQPPSATTLIAKSMPTAPPSFLTQIMLIANPTKEAIKIRFKFDYNINGQQFGEMGECANFPPM